MKYLTGKVGKAIGTWHMITNGEKIAVGLSGGKDSSTLLYILTHFQRIAPIHFDLIAIHIDFGWHTDVTPLREFCRQLNVPFVIEPTQIGPIVFEHRQEKKPCSLCANMRRGALCTTAQRLGIKKIALGHHLDDAIETLLLNMFYNGSIKCFLPVTYLDRTDTTVIRPLVYLTEATIAEAASTLNLPVIPSPCPNCGHSKRQEIKNLIQNLETKIPRIRHNLLAALHNVDPNQLWLQPTTATDRDHPTDSPY
jgi:tRNA 2-thiocytidine biosynthesis protein TtcA